MSHNQYMESKLESLTPRQIVAALDKFIVGQNAAKKAVAVALRNRFRRAQLSEELRADIIPKNILMIGPTGVGKTEIARRLATLAGAPLLKVEATKFTEVGYVGRDVDSMVRDITDIAVAMVEKEMLSGVQEKAAERAQERLLDLLVERPQPRAKAQNAMGFWGGAAEENSDDEAYKTQLEQAERLRSRMKEKLDKGELESAEVELDVEEKQSGSARVFTPAGMEEMGFDMQSMFSNMFPKERKRRKMKISEARGVLQAEEAQKLLDRDAIISEALTRVQETGIMFIDEMDKVAGREGGGHSGPQVSREGVQRDLLPIVEGSTVMTKYGPVQTNHMLFIAAGAFNVAKPSDLIPELQGRFPIRVELESLTEADFRRILIEPQNALLKQYEALLGADGVELEFTEDGIAEIARLACLVNEQTENIGARRLHTMVERLLEEISFEAPDTQTQSLKVDAAFVKDRLGPLVKDEDLSRYIL